MRDKRLDRAAHEACCQYIFDVTVFLCVASLIILAGPPDKDGSIWMERLTSDSVMEGLTYDSVMKGLMALVVVCTILLTGDAILKKEDYGYNVFFSRGGRCETRASSLLAQPGY